MSLKNKAYKFRWSFWLFSILLFAVSLVCPTYCTNVECSSFGSGFANLLIGWLGAIFGGGLYLAWFANPFFFVAIFTNRKSPTVSLVMSIIALIVSLSFLRGGEVLLNEAGHTAYITSFQIELTCKERIP